jgi:hypothetical protein
VLDRRLAAPLATRLARVTSTQSIRNPLGFWIFHQDDSPRHRWALPSRSFAGSHAGEAHSGFIPLHLNPYEREPGIKAWLDRITAGLDPTFLTPEGWFTTGHGHGTLIWVTPPAAAKVVVEQLGCACLKRPGSLHLILVPRVMTGPWRRHLTRGTEAYIRIDWDTVGT